MTDNEIDSCLPDYVEITGLVNQRIIMDPTGWRDFARSILSLAQAAPAGGGDAPAPMPTDQAIRDIAQEHADWTNSRKDPIRLGYGFEDAGLLRFARALLASS